MTDRPPTPLTVAFVPTFYVINRAGMFLAKNDKTGRNQSPVKWVRDRKDASGFSRWIEADNHRMQLPFAVQSSTTITDQLDDIWTPQRAHASGVFHSHIVQPKDAAQ